MTNNELTIKHICNGQIQLSDKVVEMKEFKIVSNERKRRIFEKGKFHCGWFIYKDNQILGPIRIIDKYIKYGKRIIQDNEFPDLNGYEIINVNKNNLFNDHDIPNKILYFILNSIEDK